jgi:hypothetical protein
MSEGLSNVRSVSPEAVSGRLILALQEGLQGVALAGVFLHAAAGQALFLAALRDTINSHRLQLIESLRQFARHSCRRHRAAPSFKSSS